MVSVFVPFEFWDAVIFFIRAAFVRCTRGIPKVRAFEFFGCGDEMFESGNEIFGSGDDCHDFNLSAEL